MNRIINLLKIACDENRLRILNITKDTSLCVGEIQTILGITQSNASRHLEKIKASGIVEYEKKAQWIYYQVADSSLVAYPFLRQLLFEDINDIPIFKDDITKLKKYKASGLCCQDLKSAKYEFEKLNL